MPTGWKVTGWAVFYADKTIHHSSDISWNDLPDDGVLAVAIYYEERYGHLIAGDWYWRADGNDGEYIFGNIPSPCLNEEAARQDIIKRYKNVIFKRGMWTDGVTMAWAEEEMRNPAHKH